MAERANPAFAAGAVGIPLVAFVLASTVGSVEMHTYVHVMAGVLWTGIDLFMAMVMGPVLGSLGLSARADWFEKFTPKMSFLMPTLAAVTIFGGITLAVRIDVFPNAGPWIGLFVLVTFTVATLLLGKVFDAFRDPRWLAFFALVVIGNGAYFASEFAAAGTTMPGTSTIILLILAVMFILTVQGFGFLLPNEVLVYRELLSSDPDTERISRLGMRNAKLSGVQGFFQLTIIVLMVYLRWGGL
ncbi:hypothetical protein [Natronomonas sp.]|uniref:hypothetical protein n=1 Tax=Natronomonas sp. TaxID=2184060 RepID=UPI003FA55322